MSNQEAPKDVAIISPKSNDGSFQWGWLVVIALGIGYWATQTPVDSHETTDTVTVDANSSTTQTTKPTESVTQTPPKQVANPAPAAAPSTSIELKQKCATYRTAIESKMGFKNVGGITIARTLDEVFYSPVVNSCLYSSKTISGASFYTAFYTIDDYLENTQLFWRMWEPPLVDNGNGELVHPFPLEPNPSYNQFLAEKSRLKGN